MTEAKSQISETSTNYLIFLLTFGIAWGSRDVGCAFLEMDYIASNELGSLAGVGIIHHVNFT